MDFIQQLQNWTKGETEQGKWLLSISIVLLLVLILLFRSDNGLARGILIPLSLLWMVMVGYGSYLLINRPGHAEQIEKQYQQKGRQTIEAEFMKANNDVKTYNILRSCWGGIIVISVMLYFIISNENYKGLSLGLIGLFFGLLVIDTFLNNRLVHYLMDLRDILKS